MAGVTFGSTDAIITKLDGMDKALVESISNMDSNPDQKTLLSLQKKFQEWTTFIQMVTTINKELADALKGILQKV